MKLVFTTNNQHKFREINDIISSHIHLLTLNDIDCLEELPETKETLEGNAEQKARYISDKYRLDCFADDTGLEIDALDGRPGVYSARYAGSLKNANDNMQKVLAEMKNINNRNARFRTVIALILSGKCTYFEGVVTGKIINETRGKGGFGYDPIFVPDGYNITFAEMDLANKNQISHRARAVHQLVKYLNSLFPG